MLRLRNWLLKKLLQSQLAGWSSGKIEEQRARQVGYARFSKLPANTTCTPVAINNISAEWIESSHSNEGIILYLHGGAYALDMTNVHRELMARLALVTHCRILALDYSLAPEHPFPAALNDVRTAYLWLLENYSPSQIIIAGDSAGGGLTLATLIALRDEHKPLPAGAICISPWTDLTLTNETIKSKAQADPILDIESLSMYADFYAGTHPKNFPLLSPLYADLSRLPALLIQVGSEEILLDDSQSLTENACNSGTSVTLEVYEGIFHVFHTMSFLPETTKAFNSIAGFVKKALSSQATDNLQITRGKSP